MQIEQDLKISIKTKVMAKEEANLAMDHHQTGPNWHFHNKENLKENQPKPLTIFNLVHNGSFVENKDNL